MNSNDEKRSGNPKNPDVIPAEPDVDTGDLVVELPKSVEGAQSKEGAQSVDAAVRAPKVVEIVSARRQYFLYGLFTVVAVIAAIALAYYFFFASETVQVALHSDPPGAKVLLDGVEVGTSPVTVMVKPGSHSVIYIQSGLQSFQQTIEVKVDGTVIEQKLLPLSPGP